MAGHKRKKVRKLRKIGKKVGMTVAKQRDVSGDTVQASVGINKRMWER